MTACLNRLKQIGMFEQVHGILPGTFTQMEREKCSPEITELVKASDKFDKFIRRFLLVSTKEKKRIKLS